MGGIRGPLGVSRLQQGASEGPLVYEDGMTLLNNGPKLAPHREEPSGFSPLEPAGKCSVLINRELKRRQVCIDARDPSQACWGLFPASE